MPKKQPKESKTIEYYTFTQNTQQRSNQEVKPVMVMTEEDEEKYFNHTRNPLEEIELSTIIHQEKHFESKIVTGLMDVPRVSRPLSEPPRHA